MAHQMLFAVTLCATLALSSGGKNQENYEPQCQSVVDYGWPRFQSLEELEASPWSTYLVKVYGELPSSFPVCIYDLRAIDKDAFNEANITGHKLVQPSEIKEGDLFEGTILGYGIYHGGWKPLPDDTWTEIAHTAYPTELEGFWVWRVRGSGIWYNVGKTKVFPTPEDPSQVHKEAISFLTNNCSRKPSMGWPRLESDIFGFCAREKGYDSIQFQPQQGQHLVGTFGMTGVTELVLVNIDGKYNCGVEDASKTKLREGWMASKRCDCENYHVTDSCGLEAHPPFPYSILGSNPPLCKKQEGPPFWNRWKSCDPSTCKETKCGLQKNPTVKRQAYDTVHVEETFTI